MSISKPLLKWPGGKRQLLGSLTKYFPQNYNKYIEPFFGGGALFFHLSPKKAVINDINSELINFYRVLQKNPKSLIASISKYKVSKEDYYRIRSYDTSKLTEVQRASRFLYLNKNCFNGLYRVNKDGAFNVPYAGYVGRKIYDANEIYSISLAVKNTKILNMDYKQALEDNAEEGDLIFLDPPYLPESSEEMFNRYNPSIFSEEEHNSLALTVSKLEAKGCYIIMTSSCSPLIEKLYPQMNIEYVSVNRSISCNGKSRFGKEMVATSKSLSSKSMRALA